MRGTTDPKTDNLELIWNHGIPDVVKLVKNYEIKSHGEIIYNLNNLHVLSDLVAKINGKIVFRTLLCDVGIKPSDKLTKENVQEFKAACQRWQKNYIGYPDDYYIDDIETILNNQIYI